tara:strand:- start:2498 stop:7414 length:4917 start_codon:yes stop_codon:yes gene_type:complete
MLNTSTVFSNDTVTNNLSLIPLVKITKVSTAIYISTNSLEFDGNYYKPLLLNIPSLKESINFESRKYTISSVNLSVDNSKYDGENISDVADLTNANVEIYWKSPSCSSINDCLKIFQGKIRDIKTTQTSISLNIEDVSQENLHKDLPVSANGSGDHIPDKYRNKPIPMVYGHVDRSPLIFQDHYRTLIADTRNITFFEDSNIFDENDDPLFMNVGHLINVRKARQGSWAQYLTNDNTIVFTKLLIPPTTDEERDEPFLECYDSSKSYNVTLSNTREEELANEESDSFGEVNGISDGSYDNNNIEWSGYRKIAINTNPITKITDVILFYDSNDGYLAIDFRTVYKYQDYDTEALMLKLFIDFTPQYDHIKILHNGEEHTAQLWGMAINGVCWKTSDRHMTPFKRFYQLPEQQPQYGFPIHTNSYDDDFGGSTASEFDDSIGQISKGSNDYSEYHDLSELPEEEFDIVNNFVNFKNTKWGSEGNNYQSSWEDGGNNPDAAISYEVTHEELEGDATKLIASVSGNFSELDLIRRVYATNVIRNDFYGNIKGRSDLAYTTSRNTRTSRDLVYELVQSCHSDKLDITDGNWDHVDNVEFLENIQASESGECLRITPGTGNEQDYIFRFQDNKYSPHLHSHRRIQLKFRVMLNGSTQQDNGSVHFFVGEYGTGDGQVYLNNGEKQGSYYQGGVDIFYAVQFQVNNHWGEYNTNVMTSPEVEDFTTVNNPTGTINCIGFRIGGFQPPETIDICDIKIQTQEGSFDSLQFNGCTNLAALNYAVDQNPANESYPYTYNQDLSNTEYSPALIPELWHHDDSYCTWQDSDLTPNIKTTWYKKIGRPYHDNQYEYPILNMDVQNVGNYELIGEDLQSVPITHNYEDTQGEDIYILCDFIGSTSSNNTGNIPILSVYEGEEGINQYGEFDLNISFEANNGFNSEPEFTWNVEESGQGFQAYPVYLTDNIGDPFHSDANTRMGLLIKKIPKLIDTDIDIIEDNQLFILWKLIFDVDQAYPLGQDYIENAMQTNFLVYNYYREGCTSSDAINYNEDATTDDESCEFPVYGCTDPNADNYNPDATADDNSCVYSTGYCELLDGTIEQNVTEDYCNNLGGNWTLGQYTPDFGDIDDTTQIPQDGDADALITNPADILQHIVKEEMGSDVVIDENEAVGARGYHKFRSFNTENETPSEEEWNNWKFAFTVDKKVNSKKLMEDIAKSTKLFPKFSFNDEDGATFGYSYIKDFYSITDSNDVTAEIKNRDILNYKFTKTPLEQVYTRVKVLYKKDYADGELKKSTDWLRAADVFDDFDQAAYESYYNLPSEYMDEDEYKGGQELIFESEYIREENTALALRRFLLGWYKESHNIIEIDLPLSYISLEIGDTIFFEELIDGKMINGEDYSRSYVLEGKGDEDYPNPDSQHYQTRNEQVIYPLWFVIQTSKSIDKVSIKAIQIHDWTCSMSDRRGYNERITTNKNIDFSIFNLQKNEAYNQRGNLTKNIGKLGLTNFTFKNKTKLGQIVTTDWEFIADGLTHSAPQFSNNKQNVSIVFNSTTSKYPHDVTIRMTTDILFNGQTTTEVVEKTVTLFNSGDIGKTGRINKSDINKAIDCILYPNQNKKDDAYLVDLNEDGRLNTFDIANMVNKSLKEGDEIV